MKSYVRVLVLLTSLLLALPLGAPSTALLTQAKGTDRPAIPLDATAAALSPLPSSCGAGLPAGSAAPVCCMFGYVLLDGQPIEGAKVTITSAHGTLEGWTERSPDNQQPYYRVSLSDPPLSAQEGESITIVAEYAGHRQTITHTVLGGGQHVNVVLPRNQNVDFAFARTIQPHARAGQFYHAFGVAVDGSGVVYMADSGNARIQVFHSSGQFLYQWGSWGDRPGQFLDPHGVAVDRQGNVYVADTGNSRIQKFNGDGTWLTSWGSQGSGNGQFSFAEGIATDRDGNVYVADSGNHRIQKFTPAGVWQATWGGFGTGNGQFDYPTGLAIDQSGNVFVVDSDNSRIQKLNRAGAWQATWGGYGTGNGQFAFPEGVTLDSSGNLYVADTGNRRIQKLTSAGAYVTSWGSSGTGNGQFYYPRGIGVDGSGNVYVVDRGMNRLQKFSSTGTWLATWDGNSRDDRLLNPQGVALDASGNIYVADTSNHRIQKFTNAGGYISSWGGRGTNNGQFDLPKEMAIDGVGNIYVADSGNHRIQKFSKNGDFLASWNGAESGSGPLKRPEGVAVDTLGNVYVADTWNSRVVKFTNTGAFITSWGSAGAAPGQFRSPEAIAVDNDNVYVADSDNHRIQKFTNAGVYITSWGSQGTGNGQLYYPGGITVDSNGKVYVADTGNGRVQEFSNTGSWLASWGGFGSGDGLFDYPRGLTVDGIGTVYVADAVNQRIQIFRPATAVRPIATIVAATPRSVVRGEPVSLVGIGSDVDVTPQIANYTWTLDGGSTPFAATANTTLSTDILQPGPHTITFRVQDTEGDYSDPQTIDIEVSPAAAPGQAKTWTFLLYLDADTSPLGAIGSLAPYLNRDSPLGALYRLEHSNPNPYVTVVALYDGPANGDSFRYLIQPGGQFSQESLGELDMGDPQTLINFVRWGQQFAPADYSYLAIADRGNGLDGLAWDFTSRSDGQERLTAAELRQALIAITDNGALPIDVLQLDACLMGLLEDAYQLRGVARYLVTSENLSWSAFAYERYRAAVEAETSPATLAAAIVDQYATAVGAGIPYSIAALDLSHVDDVARKTDALAGVLRSFALADATNRTALMQVRIQTQKLDSNGSGSITGDDAYVDLYHFASVLRTAVNDSGVRNTALALQNALPTFTLHERHAAGSFNGTTVDLGNAHGTAIYYPPQLSAQTYQGYVQGGLNFPTDVRWDDYLTAALGTQGFDPTPPVPAPVPPLPTTPHTSSRIVYLALLRR